MLRRGDIRALQLGGRKQWRIERAELEAYIQRSYEETEREMQARRDAHDGESADQDYRQEEGGEG